MVALQIRRRVGDQREGCRVRLGEAVEGKGSDLADDVILRLCAEAALLHALAQSLLDAFHLVLRAFEPHGAAQLFGFAAAEARCLHGDSQQLFLEERHAEGALQDHFERGVGVDDRFAAGAPVEIGVDHLSHDRARADDGDLDHQVVEALGLEPRQGRHLRAALDLEGSNGVGALDHRVGLGVVRRQVGEVDLDVFVFAHEGDGVFQRGQHAEPQQVDLDDSEVGAVFLVPLHDPAALHAGGLDRNDFVEASRGDHDAAAVLAQVAGQPLHAVHQVEQACHAGRLGIDARLAQGGGQLVEPIVVPQAGEQLRQLVDGFGRVAEHFAHLAHRHARAIGDHIGRHGGPAAAVFVEDVLNDLLALSTRGQVEVDVRPLAAFLGEETLEEQLHPHRVHGRDAERITHRAVGRRAAALHEHRGV